MKDHSRILLEGKSGIAWSLAAAWKVEVIRNTLKKFGRRGYQKHVLLDCLAIILWWTKCLNKS